ncbi:MAG: hypothetical protein K0R27_1874 [Xanthobacteraceae bacterium]|jgi:uncharacterized protein with GYD domain|nr:hypothetical protein [Xanthobacteraceae bacterium]
MTTYIMLGNWTDQGIRNAGDAAKRLDAAKKLLTDLGGGMKSFHLTMGEYDFVVTYELPDDAVAARFTLQLAMLGNVRSRTMKAFPEAAFRELISSLR